VRLRNGSSQRAVVVVAADRSRARPVGHDLRRGRRWSRRNRQRHRASRLGDGLHRSRHALRQPAEWLSKSKSANSIPTSIPTISSLAVARRLVANQAASQNQRLTWPFATRCNSSARSEMQ
jgi:hypothetical protein